MLRKNRFKLTFLSILLISLVGLLGFTNPMSGPTVIVVFIILAFLIIYLASILILDLFQHLKIGDFVVTKAGKRYVGLVISIGLTYLLGLSTVGQLRLIDLLLVAIFEIGVIFYIVRRL